MGTKARSATRILLVDDDLEFRKALAHSFTRKGYQVSLAANGTEALGHIEAHPIDVVISDIRMPNGDGIHLLEETRERNPETPVILLLSGYTDLSTEDAYQKGAEAMFTKPLDWKTLEGTIQRLLTPQAERWARAADRVDVELPIELRFQGLSAAIHAKVVSLGRGGMFISLKPDQNPDINDSVEFKIAFEKVPEKLIGNGFVRWARIGDSANAPRGCGIEFTYLDEKARQAILELLKANTPKAYIPNR